MNSSSSSILLVVLLFTTITTIFVHSHRLSSSSSTTSKTQIQRTECFDTLCNRCVPTPPFPNDLCHHEFGGRSQKAECVLTKPGSLCLQETIYEPSWDRKCDSDRARQTKPIQCDTCIRNKDHHHMPPNGDNQDFNYIKFTNCSSTENVTVMTNCDSTCSNCNGTTQLIPFKTCQNLPEFGVDVEYSAPFRCPVQTLLVSAFNSTEGQDCANGTAEAISFTLTNLCYTEHLGRAVKYSCINE